MEKKTLLVTGSSGFIGSYVAEDALKHGYYVKGLDLKENENAAIEFVKGDIRDKVAVSNATDSVDFVIHLAAVTSVVEFEKDPVECFDINVSGFLNVLNAAHRNGVKKVLYASSAAVYTGEHFSDSMPLDYSKQHNPYSQSKIMNEMHADFFHNSRSLNTIGMRLFNVFGEGENEKGQYASIATQFMKNKEKGEPLIVYGDGSQARDFIYVGDVAKIAIKLLEKGDKPIYNVGTGEATSYKSIAEMINKDNIKYVKNPLKVYQYLTKADIKRLTDGIGDYKFMKLRDWITKAIQNKR